MTLLPKTLVNGFEAKEATDTVTGWLDDMRQRLVPSKPIYQPQPEDTAIPDNGIAPVQRSAITMPAVEAPAAPEPAPVPRITLPSVQEIIGGADGGAADSITPGLQPPERLSGVPASGMTGDNLQAGTSPEATIAPITLPSVEEITGIKTTPEPTMGAQPITGTESVPGGAVAPVQRGPDDIEGYIRQAAVRRGIDPDVAVRVAQSEGGLSDPVRQSDYVNPQTGKREESYGPFQLYMGGGLGNAFQQATGKRPSDPSAWQMGVDFALDNAAKSGWGAWYGAARAGIGNRQGLDQAKPVGIEASAEPSNGPSAIAGTPMPAPSQSTSLNFQQIADQWKGVPYVFGGAGGRSTKDVAPTDCSGFVAELTGLPAHTDAAYAELKRRGAVEVSPQDGKPGDVVFWMGSGYGGNVAYHVGMYAGANKVLDMSTSQGNGVKLRPITHAGDDFKILRDPTDARTPDPPPNAIEPPPIVDAGVAEAVAGKKPSPTELDQWSQLATSMGQAADRIKGVPVAQAMRSGNTMAYEDMSGAGDGATGVAPSAPAPPARDIRGDYAPITTAPTPPAQPSDTVEPSLAGVAPPAAPVSLGDQPWHVQLGQTIGNAISGALSGIMGAGGKPDMQQAAQDIQGRSAATAAPGEPSLADVAQGASDVMQRGAESQSIGGKAISAAEQGVGNLADAARQDYERFTQLNARQLQGEQLTPEEEQQMARSAINVVGNIDGLRSTGEVVKGVIGPMRGLPSVEPTAAGIVPADYARNQPGGVRLPDDEIFRRAVDNTPGAEVTNDGLLMNLQRWQKPEQEGMESVRTGVFYLPEKSPNATHYRASPNNPYGGPQAIEGETLLRQPLVVKGATGGKAPEVAYDIVNGKGALKALDQDVFEVVQAGGYGRNTDAKVTAAEQFLEKHGDDPSVAYDIVEASQSGNQLRYALRERAIARSVRDAGYDSVVGYSQKRTGEPFVSEVFDLRESIYPSPSGNFDVHDQFTPGGVGPRGQGVGASQDAVTRVLREQYPQRTIKDLGSSDLPNRSGDMQGRGLLLGADGRLYDLGDQTHDDAIGSLFRQAGKDWHMQPGSPISVMADNHQASVRLNAPPTDAQRGTIEALAYKYPTQFYYELDTANDTINGFGIKDLRTWMDNATAGTPGGIVPGRSSLGTAVARGAAQGGVAGGYEASQQPDAGPLDVARGAAMGAAEGATLSGARKIVGPRAAGTIARAVQEGQIPRQERAAELSKPIALTTDEEIKRIRLDKFPAEIHDELLQAAQATDFGARLRRGVMPDEAVQQLAQEYPQAIDTAIAGSRRGRAYNAEEIVGLRNLVRSQGQKVDELGNKLLEPMTREQYTTALAEHTLEMDRLKAIGEIAFGGAPAEAGRALRQFRQIAQDMTQDPAGAGLRYIERRFGSEKNAEALAAQYRVMVDQGATPVELTNFLRNVTTTWLDRLSTIRYGSMVGNATTQEVNTSGNLIQNTLDLATKPIMVGIDAARVGGENALGGNLKREVFMAEVPAQFHGMIAGAGQGFEDALFTLKHGIQPKDLTKLDYLRAGFGTDIPVLAPRGSTRADVINAVAEGPLRLLSASDALFRSIAQGGHLAAEATAAALKAGRGVNGKVAPDVLAEFMGNREVQDTADKLAQRTVLQESRPLTDWVLKTRGLPQPQRLMAETVLPFVRTPFNVMAQGVEMTPPGSIGKILYDAAHGTATVRGTEETLARGVLGTAVMGVAGLLGTAGYLTAGYPEDAATRTTLPPGWQPWSLRAPMPDGSVKYFSYGNLGPIGVPIAVMGIMTELQRKGELKPTDLATYGKAAFGVGQYLSDQTFLRGASDFLKAMREGGTAVENYTEQAATQYSPYFLGGGSLGREIERAMGMAPRDPHGALEALLATHPLTAEQVPPKRDVLGRPQVQGDSGVAAFASPIRTSTERDASVIKAFRQAGEGLPMAAPKQLRDPESGETVPLNRKQQDTWRQIFGQQLQLEWGDAGTPQDPAELRKVEQRARDRAAATVLGR